MIIPFMEHDLHSYCFLKISEKPLVSSHTCLRCEGEGRIAIWGIQGGSFIRPYKQNMRCFFQSHKDEEVVSQKSNVYRYDHMEMWSLGVRSEKRTTKIDES